MDCTRIGAVLSLWRTDDGAPRRAATATAVCYKATRNARPRLEAAAVRIWCPAAAPTAAMNCPPVARRPGGGRGPGGRTSAYPRRVAHARGAILGPQDGRTCGNLRRHSET